MKGFLHPKGSEMEKGNGFQRFLHNSEARMEKPLQMKGGSTRREEDAYEINDYFCKYVSTEGTQQTYQYRESKAKIPVPEAQSKDTSTGGTKHI